MKKTKTDEDFDSLAAIISFQYKSDKDEVESLLRTLDSDPMKAWGKLSHILFHDNHAALIARIATLGSLPDELGQVPSHR